AAGAAAGGPGAGAGSSSAGGRPGPSADSPDGVPHLGLPMEASNGAGYPGPSADAPIGRGRPGQSADVVSRPGQSADVVSRPGRSADVASATSRSADGFSGARAPGQPVDPPTEVMSAVPPTSSARDNGQESTLRFAPPSGDGQGVAAGGHDGGAQEHLAYSAPNRAEHGS